MVAAKVKRRDVMHRQLLRRLATLAMPIPAYDELSLLLGYLHVLGL